MIRVLSDIHDYNVPNLPVGFGHWFTRSQEAHHG
jgi:hypothetical protein